MTVQLPEYAGNQSNPWQLLDYVASDPLSADASSAGVATIRFPAVPADRLWQVTRAVIACSGNVLPTLRLYVLPEGQDVAQGFLRSGSSSGLFDEADYPGDGLPVREGEQIVFQWTNAQAGALASASIVYRLLGR